MAKRIPTQSIILRRGGERIVPKIGQVFDFTQEELDDIMKVNPKAVRKVINEDPSAVAEKPAAKKGGKVGEQKSEGEEL